MTIKKANMISKKEIKEVLKILNDMYPDVESELVYSTPFELLISTILAAQCTDKRVNSVTKELYKKYNTPEKLLELNEQELGEMIKSCGFYRMKSKNILNTCKILVEKYNSKVPDTIEELMTLPGVGRKTANVVVSNAFGKDAIAVDTHVFRVSNRIGLANSGDVFETEKQLMENIDKKLWSKAHHWLIYHGRRVCKARKPNCKICPISKYCLYYKKSIQTKD
ncbi:DNA-(apurinic or apyrimidinic site) lyase /endonuclease III [Caminicella sporogenes DSM 14501]|uniref:Endonuclease III n=1 Tax=Caminicella sporogenes DSM 14501 TaxID=1121266 RepID=A0A1M6MUI5_9FIRM|nr:endonuclease III [Caminicella sporogenes]SHJ87175.1 DNA-(apurinic or apyrimidinic site) lyase /endonuclease III [Caminicella sporogenes DSM 14501]